MENASWRPPLQYIFLTYRLIHRITHSMAQICTYHNLIIGEKAPFFYRLLRLTLSGQIIHQPSTALLTSSFHWADLRHICWSDNDLGNFALLISQIPPVLTFTANPIVHPVQKGIEWTGGNGDNRELFTPLTLFPHVQTAPELPCPSDILSWWSSGSDIQGSIWSVLHGCSVYAGENSAFTQRLGYQFLCIPKNRTIASHFCNTLAIWSWSWWKWHI